MPSLRLGALLSLNLVRIGVANTGQSGCPCIEWSGLDDYVKVVNGTPLLVVYPSGTGGKQFGYPTNYGTNECLPWDKSLPPYCTNEDGSAKSLPPQWCSADWCYIDKAQCNLPLVFRSSYFPNDEVYYSYATCGAQNTFNEWFGSGSASSLHSISDLISVVAGYVKATRDEIESAYVTQTTGGQGCSLTSGCDCRECVQNTGWGQKVAFADTIALFSNDKFDCLGMIVSETYKRVAGREYNDKNRVGYLYMALQTSGEYLQWPGIEWCPTNYDPRFRDWYAGPAAGPRDLVIVIDTSGSMRNYGRMELAKKAAAAVLDTVTWVDFISVVAFSKDARSGTTSLVPATPENRAYLKQYVDGLISDGSTNFVDALTAGMDMLQSSRSSDCLSSTCAGALLFLTDGEPDSWGEADYGNVRSRNSDGYVKIFGYALGAGANHDIPKRLASEHGGHFHAVDDGGNLGNAMSSYYQVFADNFRTTNAVRWISYIDYITQTELLAGCLPLYDRTDMEKPTLLGVTCMDLNLIVDLDTLKGSAGWKQFSNMVEADSRKCGASSSGDSTDTSARVLTGKCENEWRAALIASEASSVSLQLVGLFSLFVGMRLCI